MKKNKIGDLYWGIILVVVGVLLLAGNLGYIDFEFSPRMLRTYWPLILIAVGISVVLKSITRKKNQDANRVN